MAIKIWPVEEEPRKLDAKKPIIDYTNEIRELKEIVAKQQDVISAMQAPKEEEKKSSRSEIMKKAWEKRKARAAEGS